MSTFRMTGNVHIEGMEEMRARAAARLVIELIALSGEEREALAQEISDVRGGGHGRPKVSTFSNWWRWGTRLTDSGRPGPILVGAVLDHIAPLLAAPPVGIELTERRRHAIELMLLGAQYPQFVERTMAQLTYDPVEVFREVISQVNWRGRELPERYAGNPAMRNLIARWSAKEQAQTERARTEIARRLGLDPTTDFHEIERIRAWEEADLDEMHEANAGASEV